MVRGAFCLGRLSSIADSYPQLVWPRWMGVLVRSSDAVVAAPASDDHPLRDAVQRDARVPWLERLHVVVDAYGPRVAERPNPHRTNDGDRGYRAGGVARGPQGRRG